MIWHEAIDDAYPSPIVDLSQNLLRHGVVVGLAKQRESTDLAIEHMVGKVSGDLYGFRLPKQ